jgi:hypothetical protein
MYTFDNKYEFGLTPMGVSAIAQPSLDLSGIFCLGWNPYIFVNPTTTSSRI